MVAEAERFSADDEAQHKRIEALDSLSSFIYGLKTQLGNQDGLGGKLSEDKKTILNTIKDTTEWIEEKTLLPALKASKRSWPVRILRHHIILQVVANVPSEVQGVVNPITSKLYSSDPPLTSSDDDDILHDHDEL